MGFLEDLFGFGKSADDPRAVRAEAQALFQQGIQLESQSKPWDATRLYAQAAQKDKGFSPPLSRIAWIYAVHNRELGQAKQVAMRGVSLAANPHESAIAYEALSEVHGRSGELDDAIWCLRKCLEYYSAAQMPPPHWVPFRLACAFALKKDSKNAEPLFRQAIRAAPDLDDYCAAFADFCRERRQFIEARKHYEVAQDLVEKRSDLPPDAVRGRRAYILSQLGFVAYELEEYDEAWGFFEAARALSEGFANTDPRPTLMLAHLAARKAEEGPPKKQKTHLALMRQYLEQGIPKILPHDGFLINAVLHDPFLRKHRDLSLGLMLNYGIIMEAMYYSEKKQEQPVNGDKATSPKYERCTFLEGVIMGDQYNVGMGQGVGRNPVVLNPQQTAGNITSLQKWEEVKETVDLPKLAAELAKLRASLKPEASTLEQEKSVAAVTFAEDAAQKGDGPGVMEHLAKAGKWALDVATKIGVNLATAALRAALNLGP